MTAFRPKLWTTVGAVALLSACSPGGEAGEKASVDTGAASSAAAGEAGESAAGEGGAGEAGATAAYSAVPAASRTALRIAHLRGFFLIAREAQKSEGDDAAAALAGQGMLEVFDPVADVFRQTGLDATKLRAAVATGDTASLTAAIAELDRVRGKVGGDPAAVVNGMTGIAAGLYANVVADGAVDPVEYQHSRGAALSAQVEADRFAGESAAAKAAKPDLDKFLTLWPGPVAPEDPAKATPPGQVSAQAARIQLALS